MRSLMFKQRAPQQQLLFISPPAPRRRGQEGGNFISPNPNRFFLLFYTTTTAQSVSATSICNTIAVSSKPTFTTATTSNRNRFDKKLFGFHFKNPDDALALFHWMLRRRPLPPVVQFNQLLQALVDMKHYMPAISLFKEMVMVPVVDVYTMTIAINCCCLLKRTDLGYAILGSLLKRGYRPTSFTFTSLLKGLVLENRISEVEMLFKKLIRDKLCEPTEVTYSVVMDGLCKTGNTQTAVKLFRSMGERGPKPDTTMYNTIIDGLCKDGKVDDALNLLYEMISRSISPDVITFNSLIYGICKKGLLEDAKSVVWIMIERNVHPDVFTYNALIDGCCKQGLLEDAENVICTMIQRGVDPNIVSYSSLIHGYCLRGQMEEAVKVFDSMVHRGISPNIICYSILINGYCKSLKVDEAMRLLKEISNNHLSRRHYPTCLMDIKRRSRRHGSR